MDRHRFRFDADPDPTFDFDADPDPDPTPSFTHVGKSELIFGLLITKLPICIVFLISVILIGDIIFYVFDSN